MKKILVVLAIVVTSVLGSGKMAFAQGGYISIDVVLGNRPPNPSEQTLMSAEEARHPNVAKAMRDIGNAMTSVKETPDDFGGNKSNAQNTLRAAYIALRKALYYHIYRDTH
jgi:hypothetical protein